jgi:hypothetical protein
MTTNQTPAKVPNLRETRKAMAAAKRRHPAGKAPAKAPAKAAPKPAAKAAAKQGDKPARATLRWQFPEPKDKYKDGKVQVAAYGDGELAILRSGEKWTAVYRVNGKVVETLAEPGSFGKAYNACTKRNKGAAA